MQGVNSQNKYIEVDRLISEHQQGGSQLKKRVISGLVIGICVGGVVLAGGWIFAIAIGVAVFIGAREYFVLVRSRGISVGMVPPPRYLSRVCSVICALMPIWTQPLKSVVFATDTSAIQGVLYVLGCVPSTVTSFLNAHGWCLSIFSMLQDVS